MPTNPCFLSQVTPKQLEEYLDKHPDIPGWYYNFFKDNYLKKGLIDQAAVIQAAHDLNMPPNHLRRIMDRNKTVRKYNQAAATAARTRRRFLRENEEYVRKLSSPYLYRIARFFWDIP